MMSSYPLPKVTRPLGTSSVGDTDTELGHVKYSVCMAYLESLHVPVPTGLKQPSNYAYYSDVPRYSA